MSEQMLMVLISDTPVGIITQLKNDKLRFEYDDDYRAQRDAIPLSLSMPLVASSYNDAHIRPFLWGLLPNNNDILNHWGRQFQANPRNPFALLAHIGEDLQGAIQIVPPDQVDVLKKREGITYLSEETLEERFEVLLRHPGATQFTEGGGQFSLAGAQRKKALYLVKGKWYEPRGRTPTTHILKPPIDGLAGQIENEMFCLRLAPRIGLPAPKCWTESFGKISVVVIERYDRRRLNGKKLLNIDDSGGTVYRVHQEDCCQALRIDPRNKYQSDGGPGMKDILQLLSGSGKPSVDRDRFMRACAYNFVIAGSDAHAKNYGILLAARGKFRLAPLYDIASWLPYSKNHKDRRLAMSVDRIYRYDQIMPRHWEAEARKAHYDPDQALAHIRDLIAHIPDTASDLLKQCKTEGFAIKEMRNLVKLITERCKDLSSLYGAEDL